MSAVDLDWEREARNWIAWARTPDHHSYWSYSPAFFDLLPSAGEATLDLGCGEGRVARDLAARGHRVTGIDAAPTLVAAARDADPTGAYVLADAAALPFDDASFDLVVAYNSLMDIADMPKAVAEAARVLTLGGRLCLSVTHPINDAGSFTSDAPDAPFVISGSYFGRRPFEATVTRDGLTITFRGWVYAPQEYVEALEAAGLLIETMREPGVPALRRERKPRYARWGRIPAFLWIRARRPC